MSYPRPIEKLIELFTKFPGIGPKQAARFAFYLLKEDSKTVNELSETIKELKEKVRFCRQCFKSVELDTNTRMNTPASPELGRGQANDTNTLCEFCKDKNRDENIIMVIEKEQDLLNIERTKKFNGLYHILGGTISPLDSSAPVKLHLKDLFERVRKIIEEKKTPEIILATNPTTEGDTTALYIERVLKPLNVKISRLGRGLGTGSELEYADELTIKEALTNRK